MSERPIIDAGPALNFFSINKERLLIGTMGRLTTTETVEREVLRKARTDSRFAPAEAVWKKVAPNFLEVRSDDTTPALEAVVVRLTGLPMAKRMQSPKDLGETMVISHAVVAAEAGADVIIIIDEGDGAKLASSEARRLDRLRGQGRVVGSVRLVSSLIILERAAGSEHVPDKSSMREIYARLRSCDDGLIPIERTRLLSPNLWATHRSP